MKVQLTRSREIYGRKYAKGGVVDVPSLYGKRLIYIGDAKTTQGKISESHTELPVGIPHREKLISYGFDTREKVAKGNLTTITGIGQATERQIKNALK